MTTNFQSVSVGHWPQARCVERSAWSRVKSSVSPQSTLLKANTLSWPPQPITCVSPDHRQCLVWWWYSI